MTSVFGVATHKFDYAGSYWVLGVNMVDSQAYILSKFPDKSPNSAGEIHAACPFHDDRSPSFSINVERGVFVCGSARCGVRGNFALFYKMMENITSWREVYDRLKVNRIALDIEDLFATKPKGQKQYEISQFPAAPHAVVEEIGRISYLEERGLGAEVVDAFGLIYGRLGVSAHINVQDSIILPVYDLNGTYLTFQVRYLNPVSRLRWRTPSNSPIQQLLYGGWIIPWNRDQQLWIVEGASDVWGLFQHGVQSVGLFTKEASDAQLNRIVGVCCDFGLTPVVCLDGDAATEKKDYGQVIRHELMAFGLDALIVHLEHYEDPGALSGERLAQLRLGIKSGKE